ncbi:hypothetical protein PIIN_03406 [Serendipita indica DSM 11827]|uniref:Secreted protein n=1 Tax=Serendipita indica (strain DSM 11827) TaxID=1109443 RepID=G4TDU8_SERID|nr:hypothetical protein PIIN_03406 [Serendipita indica DSM 11827]
MSQFRLTSRNRRTLVSVLFVATFFTSVATVSASDVLPCPARPRRQGLADSGQQEYERPTAVTIAQRPKRRWIEERIPPKPS